MPAPPSAAVLARGLAAAQHPPHVRIDQLALPSLAALDLVPAVAAGLSAGVFLGDDLRERFRLGGIRFVAAHAQTVIQYLGHHIVVLGMRGAWAMAAPWTPIPMPLRALKRAGVSERGHAVRRRDGSVIE